MLLVEEPRLDFLDGVEHEYVPNELRVTKENAWSTNDSGFAAYCAFARSAGLPYLGEIVRSQLGDLATSVVALDIAGGSNGVAVQDLLREGLIDHGIVTNYTDTREPSAKQNPSLKHIAGDLIERSTWQEIINRSRELAPDGLGLIMHRPDGALQYLRPAFYRGAAHLLLDMLRPGGVLFAQTPYGLVMDLDGETETVCASIASRSDVTLIKSGEKSRFNSIIAIKND